MTEVIRTSPQWRIFLCSRLADLSHLKQKGLCTACIIYWRHITVLYEYVNACADLSPRALLSKAKVYVWIGLD
jgi:hypothetical protein